MIAVLAGSLPFLYVIARKPILRRLALRNAVRRPRETLLVVLGSLLGTAIMTGSYVVGDTFDASIRRIAHEQLGPVDEVVAANGLEGAARLQARLSGLTDPDVDGVLALTRATASAATVTTPRRAAPEAQLLETDFAQARAFGGDPAATGISGPTPRPGEAAIGRDLARRLRAGTGDEIEVFAFGASTRLRVGRVLPKLGIAGFWDGEETASHNVFVAPGTIAALVGDGAGGAAPPQSLVVVSNRGGVEDGVGLTGKVSRLLAARVAGEPIAVNERKQLVLDRAERAGASLARLYSSLGLFAVLAGILLLVNIFFMLADERKSELGMLRAVGLRRASLVGAFATEGWCYAVVSAVAGTFAGLGLGRALMAVAARLFASRTTDTRLNLHFAFRWDSVQRGLVVGFAISVLTVVLTSVWLSRFNIIQAIRDVTEPARRRPRRRLSYVGLVLAVAGLAVTSAATTSASFLALLVGPVLVFVGVGPTLARVFTRAVSTTGVAVAVLVWAVVAVPAALVLDAEIDVLLFVVQGLVLVGAAVVLFAQHQEALGRAVGRFARGSLRVRLGLAYPLARRFRTSMTLGMFALVVFILVMVSVFASMFSAQIEVFTRDASGGFDVIVQSNPSNPVPLDRLAREPGVRAVAPVATAPVRVVEGPGLERPRLWAISGYGAGLVDRGAPALDDRGGYTSDEAAYRAVLADPRLAIVDRFFLSGRSGPPRQLVRIGDRFVAQDEATGARRTFRVAALASVDVAENGVLVGDAAMRALFGPRAVPNRAYVDVDDPVAFADAFAGRYLAQGGRAETIRHVVETEMAQQQQFFLLMRGYLALGLVVGIAGIGVIMVRAVRERRRQVGVLRALGFQAAAVRAAFVVESAFVAVEGVLIGTVLALVCSWSITLTDAFGDDMQFRVPIVAIALLMAVTMLFALVATAAPARSASRIEPAVALRIAD
jgi:putative ABC transport system permease protein